MEGKCCSLGRGVVDHVGGGEVRGEGGDCEDHAVVAADHGREELLGEEVVGEGVYVEGEADVFFGGVEDGFSAGAAGVVDEDGGVAEGAADGGGGGIDGVFGGEVALEEVDGGGSCGWGFSSCLFCGGRMNGWMDGRGVPS